MDALNDIKDSVRDIKGDIREIKVDVSHHIKRSDKHEAYIMKIIMIMAISAGAGLIPLKTYIMKIIS